MRETEFFNNLCITELTQVRIYADPAECYPMQNFGRLYHGFLYTVSGTEMYHFEDRTVKAVPGSILYIPKGERYKITLLEDNSKVITVDVELAGEPIRPFTVCFHEVNTIGNVFSKLQTLWTDKSPAYYPECKSLCYKFAALASKQIGVFLPTEKYEKIVRGVEYLHRNYLKNDFRLEDAAAFAGVSLRYFEVLFSCKFGITPKEYVISLKIDRAKELLLDKGLLIRDITLMLGYNDIYHFGKLFTEKTGCTPSRYRDSAH